MSARGSKWRQYQLADTRGRIANRKDLRCVGWPTQVVKSESDAR